jgi:hypothetical protein
MRTRLCVALASLAIALAACGGGGSSAAQTVANAATKTAASHTANLTISFSSDGTPPVTLKASGGTDFVARQQHVTATNVVGVPGIPDGLSIELIVQSPLIYAHPLGPVPALKGAGITQPWLKLDIRTLESLHGLNFGPITAAGTVEPTQYLDFLQGATAVTKVGTESVGGQTTTHYKATADLNAAVKKVSGQAAVTLNKDIASLQSPLVPMEVWIDGQGLIRKLTAALSINKTSTAAAYHAQLVFDLSGFGAAVQTAAPAANQTADLAPLLGALAGGATSG